MGLNFLRSSIWTPDIVLLNAAGNGDEGLEKRTLVKVPLQILFFNVFFFLFLINWMLTNQRSFPQIEHTGRVTLLTQAIYVSKCSVRGI